MTASSAPRRIRWSLWLPLALFLGLGGLLALGLIVPKDSSIPSRLVGKPLPAFNLPAGAEGKPGVARADFTQGKPKLLNIFASWCIPCAAEAPVLAELAAAGVEIDGVAVRDRKDDLAAFLARNGNPFTRIGADDLSTLQLAIGSSGVPETYVIDGRGIIRYQHIGDIRPEQVPMILEKLKEAGR